MRIPATIILLIVCSLFSSGLCRSLLHEQHATVSIKTKTGQVYNCVEFHKQPAFSNPSLELDVLSNIAEIQGKQKHTSFGLQGDGCPIGTVPILFISNDTKFGVIDAELEPPPPPEKHCHAVVRTRLNDPNKKFFGIGGEISLYKPELHNGRQWSSARMKIINGGESIEAGWMVNPTLFHDNEAHLFTRFIGAGKDCINTQCQGGFVQIDTQVALGIIPEAYSVIGGDQYTWTLSIDKDNNSGHWWLSLYTANKVKISVGYWPKEMFTSLLEFGSQIEWGGETDNPEQSTPRPHMGDGRLATYDSKVCAFVANALYVGRNGVHNDPEDTEKLQDCYSSYTVLDHGYRGSTWGRILYFGGPQSIL